MYHQWLLESCSEQITEPLYVAKKPLCGTKLCLFSVTCTCAALTEGKELLSPLILYLLCFQDQVLQGIKSASLDIYHSALNIHMHILYMYVLNIYIQVK